MAADHDPALMRWLARLGAAAAFLLAGGVVIATGLPDQAALLAAEGEPAPVIGAPAPAFSAVTAGGASLALADLRGQAVVLNFWATWCGPCEAEMPALQSVYEANREQGVRVMAVNVDEPPAVFAPWAAARGLTFDLLPDAERAIQRAYHLRGVPQTVIIGPDGVIRAIFYGPVTSRRVQQALDALPPAESQTVD